MELLNAAEKGDFMQVERLVNGGARVEVTDDQSQTALTLAARNGHMGVVRILVEHGAEVNISDNIGWTPLMRAASGSHLDVVQFLVEHGADANAGDDDYLTPLMWVARGGHLDMVRFLVEHGANMDACDEDGWTPLICAAVEGHFDVVRLLVELGADMDDHDCGYRMPLIEAAFKGHLDIVKFLVEHGADVNDSDNVDHTPLLCAAKIGHMEMVQFLVEHDADADSGDYNARPLIQAALHGHLAIVRFLKEHGASVEAIRKHGAASLICAARDGHFDMVRFLVEHEANVDAHDHDGWTPLVCAASSGHLKVVQYLVEHRANVDASNDDGETPVMRAANGGHLNVVRYLVENGATVDDRDNDKKTPLICAVIGGHLSVVQFFAEHGADVDAKDIGGKTPLMWATDIGRLDMVQYLVEHGATVDTCDIGGKTALMCVAKDGHLDMMRYLVEHGANIGARDKYDWTPLISAVIAGNLDKVKFLLESGAPADAHGDGKKTLLICAARDGHLAIVRLLMEHGSNVDAHDKDGETSLICAASGGHFDIVQLLVQNCASIDAFDSNGWTSLMRAASNGHLNVVQILVEQKAVVDCNDNDGRSPLMQAAHNGHLDVARFLVEHKADVNASENGGLTSLLCAAFNGHLDVVRFLVEHKADVNASEDNGWTPLMCAARQGYLEIAQYLVEHGANPNLKSSTSNSALSIANELGRQEIVQFLLPLVRYQDRRTQTQHFDDHVPQTSNIPLSWLIPPFEVEVEPFVDAGHIGGDYRGKWLDADVVVKLFVDDTSSATFVDEVRLWHQLRHPNVLKLYGVCNSFHNLFVCEYASNGSLPEYLKSCDTEHQSPWKFLYEAALGLEYLHERKIIHSNLRGNNILIGSDGLAKLSRFKLSASSSEEGWYASGEWVRWAAPESLRGEKISLASDVYSFCMCILEAVSGHVPFYEQDEQEVSKLKDDDDPFSNWWFSPLKTTTEQWVLVIAMCHAYPSKRPQMPEVVSKLERIAKMEAAKLLPRTSQIDPELIVTMNDFDYGQTSSLWDHLREIIAQTENIRYRHIFHDLQMIYDILKADRHSWSTLQHFRDLLRECERAIKAVSQHSRIFLLSATRARDHSIQSLHRRIAQLLQLVRPQNQDAEARETEWKRLCKELVAVFVSEASEACVLLNPVGSEEDRLELVAVLRTELRNNDGKYTEQQLAVLQKTVDEIISKSFEEVKLATTPEWFIPWFELEMNEMTTLGEGGFGTVFKTKWLDSEVVVKKLEIDSKDTENVDKKREMRLMFEREVDIWFGLSHPHVVRLFGACHVGRPFFVCELASNGTLDKYLRRHPDELWLKLREAALGVQYLHARGIVHGDLKGNNIVIGSDGKAKVTDFGLSGVFGDDSANEVLSGGEETEPVEENQSCVDNITLTCYDPLGSMANIAMLNRKWESYTLPLLQAWYDRDVEQSVSSKPYLGSAGTSETITPLDIAGSLACDSASACATITNQCETIRSLSDNVNAKISCSQSLHHSRDGNNREFRPKVTAKQLLYPQQNDSVSCGVYCLAQVLSNITGDRKFEMQKRIPTGDVEVLRLSIMWEIMCGCDETQQATDSGDQQAGQSHFQSAVVGCTIN